MGKDKHKRHKPLAEDVSQPYVVSRPSKRRKERESKRKDADDEVFSSGYVLIWSQCSKCTVYITLQVCTIRQVA